MGRSRSTHPTLPPYLYVERGKRKDLYFTIIQGKRIKLGHDLLDAKAALRDARNDTPAEGTIADMCRRFIAYHRKKVLDGAPELAESTIDEYEYSLTRFVLPVFGALRAGDFQPTHSAQYLFQQREKNRAIRGNREMAALGSAFNYGMSMGMIPLNPCHGVKRNKETPRSRRPETVEVNRLTQVAKSRGPGYYMVTLIGLMVAITGRRRAEILSLHKDDLTENGIRVLDAKVKTGQPERVYLVGWSSLLRELITEAIALDCGNESGFIFATKSGQPYTDQGFKSMWARNMNAFLEEGGTRFTAHDLRAYYVTEKSEKGENPETHKNPATTKRIYDRSRVVKVKPLG